MGTDARWWGTLRAKWTFAVLAVAVVPMLILGWLVLDIQRTGLAGAEKELEAAVVDEAASGVLAALEQAADVSARVSKVFADEAIDPDARTRLIGDIVARAPAISGVAFFDEERRFVDAAVPLGTMDESLRMAPSNERGFRVAMLHDGSRVPRHESPLARGFLVVGLARDVLGARLRDVSQIRFGAPDRVYLVDESRHVLGGSAHSALPIFGASSFPANFTTGLIQTIEFSDNGVQKVATMRTMPEQQWALIVERPTDEAFAALGAARRTFYDAIAVLGVLVLLVGFLVVRRGLRPIGALMALVQRYGKREFAARSEVASGDELEDLGASLEHMADDLAASEDEIQKRAREAANLRRYMPEEAAEAATKEGSLDLGGAKRRVTVVFADVVAFTGFAEGASPERAVAFLNELFTMLSEIVFRHDGMVDKFIGDCIMAVFRPSGDAADDAARALAAAEDMHAFVASNLPRWREAYAFDVELGIGVATGDVLMGNLGSASRMEYTVIGDAVNVAARLEALARPRQTLITRAVADACPDVSFTSLGEHALRGKANPVEVLEVAP